MLPADLIGNVPTSTILFIYLFIMDQLKKKKISQHKKETEKNKITRI